MSHKARARNARPYGHGGVMRSSFFPQHCRGAHRAPVIGICAKFRICTFTERICGERAAPESGLYYSVFSPKNQAGNAASGTAHPCFARNLRLCAIWGKEKTDCKSNRPFGTSNGNRTHDFALRGQRLNRLTMEAYWLPN